MTVRCCLNAGRLRTIHQYVKQHHHHHQWPPTWTELPNIWKGLNVSQLALIPPATKYAIAGVATDIAEVSRSAARRDRIWGQAQGNAASTTYWLQSRRGTDWDTAAGAGAAPGKGGGSLCTGLIVFTARSSDDRHCTVKDRDNSLVKFQKYCHPNYARTTRLPVYWLLSETRTALPMHEPWL